MPETLPARTTASRPLLSRAPFRALREEMDDLISRLSREWDVSWPMADFRPSYDLSETAEALEVRMDVPGIKPEDVTVEVSDNTLHITGERKEEKEEKGRTFHRIERSSGKFTQSLTLPCAVKQDKVQADVHEGVLKVTMPKCEAAKTHKVKVNGNNAEAAKK